MATRKDPDNKNQLSIQSETTVNIQKIQKTKSKHCYGMVHPAPLRELSPDEWKEYWTTKPGYKFV